MADATFVLETTLPKGKFMTYQSQPSFALLKVKQTHSDIVHNENNCSDLEGDGMVGSGKEPMAILTADCLPVVLLGNNQHAFVHAGWRGLQNQILHNDLIKKMHPTYAYVGPHISVRHYEVQPDFKNNFSEYKNAFVEKDGKLFFNMSVVVKSQLEKFYPGIKIEFSELCTFEDSRLHSYRRNNTKERNWNIYIP
jgi:YfiH family protein